MCVLVIWLTVGVTTIYWKREYEFCILKASSSIINVQSTTDNHLGAKNCLSKILIRLCQIFGNMPRAGNWQKKLTDTAKLEKKYHSYTRSANSEDKIAAQKFLKRFWCCFLRFSTRNDPHFQLHFTGKLWIAPGPGDSLIQHSSCQFHGFFWRPCLPNGAFLWFYRSFLVFPFGDLVLR